MFTYALTPLGRPTVHNVFVPMQCDRSRRSKYFFRLFFPPIINAVAPFYKRCTTPLLNVFSNFVRITTRFCCTLTLGALIVRVHLNLIWFKCLNNFSNLNNKYKTREMLRKKKPIFLLENVY